MTVFPLGEEFQHFF